MQSAHRIKRKSQDLHLKADVNLRRIEVPRLKSGNLFMAHSTTNDQQDSVMNYCLEYDPSAHHSRWVAYRFDSATRQVNVHRSDEPFADDPDAPVSCSIGNSSFGRIYYDLEGRQQMLSAKKFDRGHLCASADRYMNREANEQTFYMTNMSPQLTNFNSPYWSSFENYVRKRGRDEAFADTLYVVKGGTIAPDQILGHIQRPNGTMVVIPRYYFMALLRCKNNRYSAIAFLMEHKDYGEKALKNREMAEMTVSIDALEAFTGIDFFHNLPDDVENAVEKVLPLSEWGF